MSRAMERQVLSFVEQSLGLKGTEGKLDVQNSNGIRNWLLNDKKPKGKYQMNHYPCNTI